jgi:hypothetical protein
MDLDEIPPDPDEPAAMPGEDSGITKSDVLRQALALMKAARDGKKQKRHLGLVSDPRKLETEIVGFL